MPGSYTLSSGRAVTINAKAVKAKCEDNQTALERLQERMIKEQENPNSKFIFTLRKALKSLKDCPHPITTTKQACELKFVGSAVAKIIVQNNASTASAAGTATKKANKDAAATTKKVVRPSMKRQDSTSLTAAAAASSNAVASRVSTTIAEAASAHVPSTKEKAYNKARKDAQNLELQGMGLLWKVILLIDGRERKSEQVVSACKQVGIPCEERHLPIGDMAWIAQCVQQKTASSESPKPIEIMIGTIIERKDVNDLVSSLYGTRYSEQRLRLSKCGLPQVLFLVEGDVNNVPNCPAETLHMAMMETRIQLGFQVVQTKTLADTTRVLKGLHRRIVQRTFPEVFDKDEGIAVPSFGVSGQNEVGHRLGGDGNSGSGRRRNRRATSLLEMVFDTDPKPPFSTSRFITYPELKAKVEFDREQGTRGVQAISMAMMKQIPSLSQKKCTAIAQEYPTMNRLIQEICFFEGNPTKLVSDISVGKQSVGPKSAQEVVAACCTLGDGSIVSSSTLVEEPAKKRAKRTKASFTAAVAAPVAASSATNTRATTAAVAAPARAPAAPAPAAGMFPVGDGDEDDAFSDDSFQVAPVGSFDSRKRPAAGSSVAAAAKKSTARKRSRFVTNLDDSLFFSSPDTDFVTKRAAASTSSSSKLLAREAAAAAAENRLLASGTAHPRAKSSSPPEIIDIADSDTDDNDTPLGRAKAPNDPRHESDLQRAIRLSILDTPSSSTNSTGTFTPGVPSGRKQKAAARKVSNDSVSRDTDNDVDDSLLLSSPEEEETSLRSRLAQRLDREVIEIDLD